MGASVADPFVDEIERFRGELRVHCYRLVGSFDEAEDLVQETMVRAWRGQDGFGERASLRSWLYTIATNICLDFLRKVRRRPRLYAPVPGMTHGNGPPPDQLEWLQPYPDALLTTDQPEDQAVERETIELVFLTAIQHLPPKQRAVFVGRDVLGWSAAETADVLQMSVASVNSALQRAKTTLRDRLADDRTTWSATDPTEEEQRILHAYMTATRTGDFDAVSDLLTADVVLTMPPNSFWFHGRDAMLDFIRMSLDPAGPTYFGEWTSRITRANRMPAVAHYVRRPGTTAYRAQVLDVLRIKDGRIAEITSFEPHLFVPFGLPLTVRD